MQPFQAFLTDTRTRPLGLRYLGYFVSLGVHAPPATVFVMSWLTQALLLGGGMYDLPTSRNETIYYRVPIALHAHFPGLSATGSGGGSPTAGGAGKDRRGAAGRVRHRARRPLVLHHRKQSTHVLASKPAAIGPEEHVEEDAGINGPGGHGIGGITGNGNGIGNGGPGGEGDGPGGMGVLAAAREPRTKRPRPKVVDDKGDDQSLEEAFGDDDVTEVGTPLADRPDPRLDGLRRLPAHLRELPLAAGGLLAARPHHQRPAGRGLRDRARGRSTTWWSGRAPAATPTLS